MYNYCSHIDRYFPVSVAIEINVRQEWWPAVFDASQMAFCYVSSSQYEVLFYYSMIQGLTIDWASQRHYVFLLSSTYADCHTCVILVYM